MHFLKMTHHLSTMVSYRLGYSRNGSERSKTGSRMDTSVNNRVSALVGNIALEKHIDSTSRRFALDRKCTHCQGTSWLCLTIFFRHHFVCNSVISLMPVGRMTCQHWTSCENYKILRIPLGILMTMMS